MGSETDDKTRLERQIVRLAIALERARTESREAYFLAPEETKALESAVREYNALIVKLALPE